MINGLKLKDSFGLCQSHVKISIPCLYIRHINIFSFNGTYGDKSSLVVQVLSKNI